VSGGNLVVEIKKYPVTSTSSFFLARNGTEDMNTRPRHDSKLRLNKQTEKKPICTIINSAPRVPKKNYYPGQAA
jgi:hypothetical protein